MIERIEWNCSINYEDIDLPFLVDLPPTLTNVLSLEHKFWLTSKNIRIFFVESLKKKESSSNFGENFLNTIFMVGQYDLFFIHMKVKIGFVRNVRGDRVEWL